MVQRLPIEEFLKVAVDVPVIDVRAPAEYGHGHIPGSINIALFDDLERAEVGTLYHKAGREEAIKKGLEIVGPKMKVYVEQARNLAVDGKLLTYCWRGGMRSESMAWLFNTSGIETAVLEKGYKAFRHYIRSSFDKHMPMIVLGGKTGSGKTELLQKLVSKGFQHIDLEKLAHHKGSVFGNLGLPEQPTNEQFENELGIALLNLDMQMPVIFEDESINIGIVSIPKPLFTQMREAPLIYIDMPLEARIERLYTEYAHFPPDVLKDMMVRISRRLGGENTRLAIKAIDENNLRKAIRISLIYYDKAYEFGIKKRDGNHIRRIKAEDEYIGSLAEEIMDVLQESIKAG